MTTTVPAYQIGGIIRPALTLDASGNIIMDPAASAFAAKHRGATARTVAVLGALLRTQAEEH